eukprot:c7339_g1_i1.p1 GENE.c7339_g1_i1~~c7339_g1_i1.p1  ORF type:complete len:589 (+),score=180.81 c7339_g1_i1:335-2101(+)
MFCLCPSRQFVFGDIQVLLEILQQTNINITRFNHTHNHTHNHHHHHHHSEDDDDDDDEDNGIIINNNANGLTEPNSSEGNLIGKAAATADDDPQDEEELRGLTNNIEDQLLALEVEVSTQKRTEQELAQIRTMRRAKLYQTIMAGQQITAKESDWWTQQIIRDEMQHVPINPLEQVHKWLTTIVCYDWFIATTSSMEAANPHPYLSQNPELAAVWKKKRAYIERFTNYMAARDNGMLSFTIASQLRATILDEHGGSQALLESTFSRESAQLSRLVVPMFLHGCSLSDWERKAAAEQLKQAKNAADPSQLLWNGSDKEIAKGAALYAFKNPHKVANAIVGVHKAMGEVFPIPKKEDSEFALKNWVRTKFTNFLPHPDDQCPHVLMPSSVMTLMPSRYVAASPMHTEIGEKQLCWMCRSVITIVQIDATTGYGSEWDTQTDNLNHGLTVVCDRISEMNSSPHWQSDCKNLVEIWGPEILCHLEKTKEPIAFQPAQQNSLKQLHDEDVQQQIAEQERKKKKLPPPVIKPSSSEGISVFDIESKLSPLSKTICEMLEMQYYVDKEVTTTPFCLPDVQDDDDVEIPTATLVTP